MEVDVYTVSQFDSINECEHIQNSHILGPSIALGNLTKNSFEPWFYSRSERQQNETHIS